MANNQFRKGLENIRTAIHAALRNHAITGWSVFHSFHGSEPGPTTFTVNAKGQERAQEFTREEIEDSGEAIDSPAAAKVSALVSLFVR